MALVGEGDIGIKPIAPSAGDGVIDATACSGCWWGRCGGWGRRGGDRRTSGGGVAGGELDIQTTVESFGAIIALPNVVDDMLAAFAFGQGAAHPITAIG